MSLTGTWNEDSIEMGQEEVGLERCSGCGWKGRSVPPIAGDELSQSSPAGEVSSLEFLDRQQRILKGQAGLTNFRYMEFRSEPGPDSFFYRWLYR